MFRTYKNETIIATYFILLCLHFVLHRYVKIYPSFVFPAFSQAPLKKDHIPYNITRLYGLKTNGEIKEIDKKNFFISGYPDYISSYLQTIITNEKKYQNNKKLSSQRKDFIRYAQQQLHRINPNEDFVGIKIENNSNAYYIEKEEIKENIIEPTSTFIKFK